MTQESGYMDVALETIASLKRKVAMLKQLRIEDWNTIRAERERVSRVVNARAVDIELALRDAVNDLRRELETARKKKVTSPIVHDDSGLVALCLRCGFVTWHEKDDQVQHEADCALVTPTTEAK